MKKVLICEDEKSVQEYLRDILNKKDCEIFTAEDGQEAINKAKQINPDLILLDIRMPKLNGLEAAKKIRSFNKNAKLIFITGFESPELSKEEEKYDILNYIAKSSPTQEVLKLIDKALES